MIRSANRDIILVSFFLVASIVQLAIGQSDGGGTTTAREIRRRGFLAEDHYIKVQNGTYIVNLVRARNPLIANGQSSLKNKHPLLFNHGVVTNSNSFILTNEEGIKPKNYANISAGEISISELNELLDDDPATTSLVYLALNFGHEVWLLNRRSTSQSRSTREMTPPEVVTNWINGLGDAFVNNLKPIGGMITSGPAALMDFDLFDFILSEDHKFWNFSFEDQGIYDLPEAIEYVLDKTGFDKLNLIGHSAGGTSILSTLILVPKTSKKMHKGLLWAPAFHLGETLRNGIGGINPLVVIYLALLEPYFETHIGTFPPEALIPTVQGLVADICPNHLPEPTLCRAILDLLFGPGGGQQRYEFLDGKPNFLDASSTVEFQQYNRALKHGKLHYRDFQRRSANMIAYGQPEPPVYDASKITARNLYFYGGITDQIVAPKTYPVLFNDLKVPYKYEQLGSETIQWNHVSFLLHKYVAKMLIIPNLQVLESD